MLSSAQLSALCLIIPLRTYILILILILRLSIDGLQLEKHSAFTESVSPLVLRSLKTVNCKYFLLENFGSCLLVQIEISLI